MLLEKLFKYYLILPFSFGIISGLLGGFPLIFISDVILIIIAITIMLNKNEKNSSVILSILLLFSLLTLVYIFRYGFNLNSLSIIRKSRVLFIFLIMIFVFNYIFSKFNYNEFMSLKGLLIKIIKINILFILLELYLINYFNLQYEFFNLFKSADYRVNYGSFLEAAPNSLVFGRQNASIISVIAILIFTFGLNKRNNLFWFLLSIISFMLSITTTGIICLVLSYIVITVFLNNNLSKTVYSIISGAIIYIIINYYVEIFSFRYGDSFSQTSNFIERLYFAFTEPFEHILNNPLEILFGTGSLYMDDIKYSSIMTLTESFEIAFVFIAVKHGIIFVITLIIIFLRMVLKQLTTLSSKKLRNQIKQQLIFYLCFSLPLFISLIHYNSLFKPGLIQIFSVSLLIPTYIIKFSKDLNRTDGFF